MTEALQPPVLDPRLRKTVTRVGDTIAIGIGQRKFALAQVLYISAHFRNVILLGVFRGSRPRADLSPAPQRPFVLLIYTGKQSIQAGAWPVLGNSAIATEDAFASLRLVGSSVYLADQRLRTASSTDRQRLPKMLVAGEDAVRTAIRETLRRPSQ